MVLLWGDFLSGEALRYILVVDDVLTAGAHFVAIKRRLSERFPSVGRITRCFWARRALLVSLEDEPTCELSHSSAIVACPDMELLTWS
jgi:hypothetical protein